MTTTYKFGGHLDAPATIRDDGTVIAASATVSPTAHIGAGTVIWPYASIGERASIGHEASIGYRVSIGGGDWWVTIGPQGTRGATLTVVQSGEGLRWWVGCQCGITTEALLARVTADHGDGPHGDDYRAVIAFVEAHPGRLRWLAQHAPTGGEGE